jgi:zinc and cadmium transporter
MSPTLLLVFYCALILLGSLAGGWIPLLVHLTHTRLQLAMSFVGGAMLGVGVLNLLPHAFYELKNIQQTVGWLMVGFLVMFFIERVFHFHHHDVPGDTEHDHDCGHDHDHAHAGHGHEGGRPKLSWGAALVGLSLHSTLDGVALAASVAAESEAGAGTGWAGLVVFLVVFLHKPFDSMTLGTLMALDGRSSTAKHLVNGLYALAIPLGAILFQLGATTMGGVEHHFVGCALAFAAGTFLCISTSDLLPELQFHSHDKFKLSAALLLGLSLAYGLTVLEESGHDHGHTHDHKETGHSHDHK